MKLEIGGGTNPRDGYVNVDPHHGDPRQGLNIALTGLMSLPFLGGSIDAAYASHVMEHIAQGQPRIDALNEVWRVLKPGAPFEIIVPCVGHTDQVTGQPVHNGWQPYADPTHVSFWWYPESFWYLVEGPFKANADYGIELWELGAHELLGGWEAHVTLVKPQGA